MDDETRTLRLDFKLEQSINEEHKPTEIFAVRFCDVLPSYWDYFATVGSNCASVYHISAKSKVDFVQAFVDEDVNDVLYSCCWASTLQGQPLLVVGGFRGILKVINCVTFELEAILLGHGNAINDLRTHPLDENLVFSASKDESVRLWNLRTAVCIAVFAGEKGHRDEVLSLDPHPTGSCLVSVGMDTSVKVWNLHEPKLVERIETSYTKPRGLDNRAFKTYTQQFPLFSTTQVHTDYVDSVRWVGDCLVTKSTKNRIALWAPDSTRYKGAPLILREFVAPETNLWFVRMDVCIPLDILAVGNESGKVFIYSLSSDIQPPKSRVIRKPKKETTNVKKESNADPLRESNAKGRKDIGDNDDNGDDSDSVEGREGEMAPSNGSGKNGKASASTDAKDDVFAQIHERCETQAPRQPHVTLQHPKCMNNVRQVAFDPNGRHVVYCCDDGTVWVWSISVSR